MRILVLLKMVPDAAGDLEIDPSGKALDYERLHMVSNESDEHALEEALVLKERHGGSVTVLAPDAPGVDGMLLAALAAGVDRSLKITGVPRGVSTSNTADIMASVVDREMGLNPPDLILCGVQAIDDLDGLLAPLIACQLGYPFLGTVVAVSAEPDESYVVATMEYPGGVRGEFEVTMPAILGIRAAERPPRYVSIAKVRDANKRFRIETVAAPLPANLAARAFEVLELREAALSSRAEMLEGSIDEVSARLTKVLAGQGMI
jgi:electron transfer flavoprotein beta subunit